MKRSIAMLWMILLALMLVCMGSENLVSRYGKSGTEADIIKIDHQERAFSSATRNHRWYIRTIDVQGNVGKYASIDLDGMGQPHVSYLEYATPAVLKYATWDQNGTTILTAGPAVPGYTDIVVDSNNVPHISYVGDSDSNNHANLEHRQYSGTPPQWQSVDIIDAHANGAVGDFSSIVMGPNNRPCFSYYDGQSRDLKYAFWNGTAWEKQIVDEGSVGKYTSIFLDSGGKPHISYFDDSNNRLKYISYGAFGWNNPQVVDYQGTAGTHTSIWVNHQDNDRPHISYFGDPDDNGVGELKYAYLNPAAGWINQTVDNGGGARIVGEYSSIAGGNQGEIHISYYDDGGKDLKYAYYDGNWHIEPVDVGGMVGKYTSIAVDGNNTPHIVYYDETNGDLKYAAIDDTPPTLVRDYTPNTATTGDTFEFNISASDNFEVDKVYVNLSYGDENGSGEIHKAGQFWRGTTTLPHDISELEYCVYITDKANNSFTNTGKIIQVIDNDAPTLELDNSPERGFTGDNFTFSIEAGDNIGVDKAWVVWEHGTKGGEPLLEDREGLGVLNATIRLDHSVNSLNYTINLDDAAGKHYNSSPISIPVFDNDPPEYIHNETTGEPQTGKPFEINVRIQDNIAVEEISLKYFFDDGAGGSELMEKRNENNRWNKTINISLNARKLSYFFIAKDKGNNPLDTKETIGPNRLDVLDVIPPNAVAGKGNGEVVKIKTHSSFTFFGGNSTDNIEITSYTWELFYDNEKRVLEGREAVFDFVLPGTYNVTLTVRDAADNPGTDHMTIRVMGDVYIEATFNGEPIADGGEYKIKQGTTVFFDAKNSSGPDGEDIDYIHWCARIEGGDVIIDKEEGEVIHPFEKIARITITLTVRDVIGNEGNITFTLVIEGRDETEIPVPRVTFGEINIEDGKEYEIKVGTSVQLNAGQSTDDGEIMSFDWVVETDGGRVELTGMSVSHRFKNTGVFTVTLTIADDSGETGSMTFLIRVTEEGSSPRFIVGPIEYPNGEPVIGAEVSFDFNGEHYNGTTDVNGHAEFDIHPDDIPQDLLIRVSKDDITIEWEHREGIPRFSSRFRVGPLKDRNGDPVVGAKVSFEFEGEVVFAITNQNGIAVFKMSPDDVPGDAVFRASKDGITIEWKQGEAIPTFEAEEEEPGSATPVILGAVVVLAIVIIIILMIVKKRKKKRAGEKRIAELESELEVEEKKAVREGPAPKRRKPPRKEPPKSTPPPVKARPEVRAAPESPIIEEPAVEETEEESEEELEMEDELETEEELETEDEEEVWDEGGMEDMEELPLPPPPEDLIEALPALELEKASSTIKNIIPGYIITDKLGSGGFATVYKAINKDGVAVAIKLPKFLDETIDSDVLRKFQAEADIWKKLKHKNIVTFLDSNVRPVPYMTIELMEGGNLAGLLKDHRLSVKDAKPLMLQIVDGLSYAHRMASVHRDIKPENILFTKDGVPKIADWGIGKFMASESVSQSIGTKGTFAYAAPEQFDRETYGEVDWSTDIFQIGIVFYQMLTGVNPFMADELARVMGLIMTRTPKDPTELNPEIPPELSDIVMKCLAKKKEDRWRSTDVLYSKLRDMEIKKRANLKKYRRSLERALKDGKISEDEDVMLVELREHMNITDREHDAMVSEILG